MACFWRSYPERLVICMLYILLTTKFCHIYSFPFPFLNSTYRAASQYKIDKLRSCNLPIAGTNTFPHLTNDTVWLGFPKMGSSSIRNIVKLLNGRDSVRECNATCVGNMKKIVMFSRDPIDRFKSAWAESERMCSAWGSYKNEPFNLEINSPWDDQNWGNKYHQTLLEKFQNGDDYESRKKRVEQRFNNFVKSFFQWNSTNVDIFSKTSGMCEKGVQRLFGHIKSELLYFCTPRIQSFGTFCGENIQYIGDVKTMSKEIFQITNIDIDDISSKIKFDSRRSSEPIKGIPMKKKKMMGTTAVRLEYQLKFPKPEIPEEYILDFCKLYRNDFCCIGYSIPKQCIELCDHYVTADPTKYPKKQIKNNLPLPSSPLPLPPSSLSSLFEESSSQYPKVLSLNWVTRAFNNDGIYPLRTVDNEIVSSKNLKTLNKNVSINSYSSLHKSNENALSDVIERNRNMVQKLMKSPPRQFPNGSFVGFGQEQRRKYYHRRRRRQNPISSAQVKQDVQTPI